MSRIGYGERMKPANKNTRPATVKGETVPGSIADQIAVYLRKRKGKRLRCYEIAEAIGQSTHAVAMSCRRMWTRGQLDRFREFENGAKSPTTYYSAKP